MKRRRNVSAKKIIIGLIIMPGTFALGYFIYKMQTGAKSTTPTIDAIMGGRVPSQPIVGYVEDITKYTTGYWDQKAVMDKLGSWSGTKWFTVNGVKKELTMGEVRALIPEKPPTLRSTTPLMPTAFYNKEQSTQTSIPSSWGIF